MEDEALSGACEATPPQSVELDSLSRAIKASWDASTAYRGVVKAGNPAYGQCYPTSRVVQWFHPDYEIARGEVRTPSGLESHFWNIHGSDPNAEWIDLSWSQFPAGSRVLGFDILDRTCLGDSPATQARCELLRRRVLHHLGRGGRVRSAAGQAGT